MYNYFLNTIPPHTDDYLKFLLFPSNRKYDLSLKNKKKVLVTICADYGNMGDIAIAFVQMEFLQKLFPDRLIIPSLISNIYADMKSLKEIINDDDIITIIGGGNNGSLYPGIEFSRMFVISQFKKNKIISFPQTLVLEDTVIGRKVQKKMQQIYSSHPNLTLAAREEFTYRQYQVLFPNIAVLAPDIVLSYRPQLPDYERDGLLLCLRSDAEKKSTAQFTEKLGKALSANYEISFIDTTNNKVYKEINEAFAGRRKLMPFLNRQNNEDLILALQTAGVSRGRNGFRKDKGGEKLAETEEDLLQHRTDGTDAFDTLYIGCAKFPQQSTSPISISGVL